MVSLEPYKTDRIDCLVITFFPNHIDFIFTDFNFSQTKDYRDSKNDLLESLAIAKCFLFVFGKVKWRFQPVLHRIKEHDQQQQNPDTVFGNNPLRRKVDLWTKW